MQSSIAQLGWLAKKLTLVLACLMLHAGRSAQAQSVTLTDNGSTVTLANGLVTAIIQKSSAQVTSLIYRGHQMVSTTGSHRATYFSMDGGSTYEQPSGCVFSVPFQNANGIDISLKRIHTNQPHAFDIDIHYVIRRGVSGLYVYAILNHPASYPATSVGEWRMVWWMPAQDANTYLLERIYVDALRNWEMPSRYDESHAQPTSIGEINYLTTGVRAGMYDGKYEYNANYWDLGCWGHASNVNNTGAWLVFGSHEFFNDGPTKQDLTSADGIIHVHFGMNHYNGSGISVAASESWTKMFGPYLMYCNYNAAGGDACWADAQNQAQIEQASWPYYWVIGNSEYPLAEGRGTVDGTFVVADALQPAVTGAGAWVGLAQPDTGGNWQFEAKHYQYWVQADANGNFSIPNVRPGSYTLYAFVNGAVGEYTQTGLSVSAGSTTSLGIVTWNVPHYGSSIAWEIGTPDRSAAEFWHGSDYFQPFVYQNFINEFSDPLEYTVGTSNWATDWNYAQTHAIDASVSTPWKWRINFNLDSVPPGNATLILAFASSDHAHMYVYVNNESSLFAQFYPPNGGGNALIREGIHAKYGVQYVTIPTSRLHVGVNTITLVQVSSGHVMYDYLRLEMP